MEISPHLVAGLVHRQAIRDRQGEECIPDSGTAAEIAQAENGTLRVASSRSLSDGDRPSQSANALSDNRSGGRHSRGPHPITVGRLSIDEYSHAELAGLIQWIESDTLLRPKEQLIDEAMRELGFQRRGRKIIAAIEQAIECAHGS